MPCETKLENTRDKDERRFWFLLCVCPLILPLDSFAVVYFLGYPWFFAPWVLLVSAGYLQWRTYKMRKVHFIRYEAALDEYLELDDARVNAWAERLENEVLLWQLVLPVFMFSLSVLYFVEGKWRCLLRDILLLELLALLRLGLYFVFVVREPLRKQAANPLDEQV